MGLFFNKNLEFKIEELNTKIEELNNKIKTLNNVIAEKEQEVNILKLKLKHSEENSLSVESFEYLQEQIRTLTSEKQVLTDKIQILEKSLSNSKDSILSMGQLEIMEKNLKKAKEENKTLSEKVNILEMKVKEVENSSVSPKQMEIMEKNLKKTRIENLQLQEKLSHYQETAKEVVKIQVEQRPMEFSENAIFLDKFKYKILIDDFFEGTKFKEIREFLLKKDYVFLNDIKNFKEIEGLDKKKNFKSAYLKVQNFEKGIVPLEDRILLCKGAKVQKIFKSFRKFTNYLIENNLEYMDNLDGADFKALSVKASIMSKSVRDIMNTAEEYFNTYKIKE